MTDVTVIIDGEQFEGQLVNGFVFLGDRKIKYGDQTNTGKSIREEMWEELDNAMDNLMEGKPIELKHDQWQRYGHEQGVAQATAYIISLFENPTHPNMDSVRSAAVMRYRERQELHNQKTPEEVAPDVQAIMPESPDDADPVDAAHEGSSRAGQAREG